MSSKAEWHILTVSRGGTVSLLKNLTENEARRTVQRLMRDSDPWSEQRLVQEARATARHKANGPIDLGFRIGGGGSAPGDLMRVECFGPEGEDLDIWPKPDDYDDRFAVALAEAEAELKARNT